MIVDRIIQIIEYKKINKRQFYLKTGLSNGFLDKVKDIGVSKIDLILKTFPEINPDWLLTGEGSMLKNDNTSNEQDKDYTWEIIELQKFKIEALEKELRELKKEKPKKELSKHN